MDRKRISEEVIELLCNKLHNLPLPGEDPDYDYEHQELVPAITDNHLDIAEITMDLEDAFSINFDEVLPGDEGMKTIGEAIDFIDGRIKEKFGE
ncbi:MAG: hypothetical protein ACOCZK_05820 [Planctomycetota bacterium]